MMSVTQSYQHKVPVVLLLSPLLHSPFISVMAACSLLICWMRRLECVAWAVCSSPCQAGSGFWQASCQQSTLKVVMRLLCSSPWVPSAVPAALPSQEMCPVSHPLPFCKMWHNYGSTEKQGQEKGGIYYSLHLVSFELVASGFCVGFFLVLSQCNSSVGSLYCFFSFQLGI